MVAPIWVQELSHILQQMIMKEWEGEPECRINYKLSLVVLYIYIYNYYTNACITLAPFYNLHHRYFCETLQDYQDPCPVNEQLRAKIVGRLIKEGSNANDPANIALSDYSRYANIIIYFISVPLLL